MSKSKVANHIHRYQKKNIAAFGKKEFLVYRCTKPACSHYIRLDLAENKMCECNRCGELMIITKSTLHHSSGKPMAKPHCGNCIKRKTDADVDAIANFLAGNET